MTETQAAERPATGYPPEEIDTSPGTLFSKLKWLIFVRILVATALFGSTLVVQIRAGVEQSEIPLIYSLIIGMYGCSALYAILLRRIRSLRLFAYVQFFFDNLFITPLILLTGGVESIFSFLYFLTIISASYLLYTTGAVYAAALAGIMYAVLVMLQARGYLPSSPDAELLLSDMSYVFYNVIINVFAFFLVAFLASYLAEQLKRARQALLEEQLSLKELEEFNRKIVENIGSGLLTVDQNNRITFLNRAAREITGADGSIYGAHVDELFPGTAEQLDAGGPDTEDGVARRWERRHTGADGRALHLIFALSPLLDPDGQQIGKILIFEDHTRLKYLEEKAKRDERLKMIGRLAAGMAHEIRNPLASISGSIQVLSAELEPEGEEKALMDIVLRETDRLNKLLTDFLQYIRQQPVTRRPVDLEALVERVIQGVRLNPSFTQDVTLVSEYRHAGVVEGDAAQLEQVLWNLLLNAAEAVGGAGEIRVETKDLETFQRQPGPWVKLSVMDTGPGIPPDIVDRVFDPFFSTKSGGTGLGLAVVEKIVLAHDGVIQVRRREEVGTVVEVVLPARGTEEEGAASA